VIKIVVLTIGPEISIHLNIDGLYIEVARYHNNSTPKIRHSVDLMRRVLVLAGHEVAITYGSVSKADRKIIARASYAMLDNSLPREKGYILIRNIITKACEASQEQKP